jgi:hypothetical protein
VQIEKQALAERGEFGKRLAIKWSVGLPCGEVRGFSTIQFSVNKT